MLYTWTLVFWEYCGPVLPVREIFGPEALRVMSAPGPRKAGLSQGVTTFVPECQLRYLTRAVNSANGPMNHNKSDDFLDDATRSYLTQFRVHQKLVQAHLKGTLNDEQPLLPAFFPPSSYWSSDEKDLFFHGLAVYSRFRPDLIAESIKTKTTLDVCVYLDILQTASSSIPSEIHGSLRGSLEPAMEVSSKWIQNEEQIAAALTRFDSCTWIPESAKRKTKNPENRCVCSPQSLLVDYTRPSPVDHSSHTELKNSYLSHMDCNCLAALENIVRLDHVVPTPVDETGGMLKWRQMRRRFLEIGVNSQFASKNNLDFLHLSSLSQLMRMYGLLNDSSNEVSISADTIQLIVAIIKEFISEVVCGSLISKEQEIRLKGTLKAWKYNQNEITVENVKESLKSMGIAHSNLKDYFAKLIEEGSDGVSSLDPFIDTEMGTEDDNNDDSTGDQDEDEDETSNKDNQGNASDASEQPAKPSQVPTELWLPQSLRRCLLPKYNRVSKNEGDILPEIDEIELERELKEEEGLDALDLLTSREYEAELWVP